MREVLNMVTIPDLVFQMGSTREAMEACVAYWSTRLVQASYSRDDFRRWILKEFPSHPVKLKRYGIGRFLVTNQAYGRFVAATGRTVPESLVIAEPNDHPVWGVSFDDASAYAEWLSMRVGRYMRLPSEAEWECAARGPSGREFPYGDQFDSERCNTLESGIGHTTRVDHYPSGASEFGVYDLAGNVEEWTTDTYAPYPGGVYVEDDLSRRLGPRYHVLRGGSFARGGDLTRCARRHGPLPEPPFRFVGFRLVEDV
jgi:toxoflavin biosynthesis protein ToxD